MRRTVNNREEKQSTMDYGRYGRNKAKWLAKEHENTAMRKKINPRLVLTDPDVFFNDLLMEQNETA